MDEESKVMGLKLDDTTVAIIVIVSLIAQALSMIYAFRIRALAGYSTELLNKIWIAESADIVSRKTIEELDAYTAWRYDMYVEFRCKHLLLYFWKPFDSFFPRKDWYLCKSREEAYS